MFAILWENRQNALDGGSEFHAAFEAECQRRGLRLFVLPPRSPKLNGAVERPQRTHTEEFYELRPCDSFAVEGLNREARAWERIYNTVRPHQALGYLTPLEFLRGARREAKASRPNRSLRARAPGSRVATGDERSELALDAGAPRAP